MNVVYLEDGLMNKLKVYCKILRHAKRLTYI